MITRNRLTAIALATTCLAPLGAMAQTATPTGVPAAPTIGGVPYTGDIGIGVMGVMGNNANQAGRYTGLNTTGFDVLGNFDVTGRDAWNSADTRFFSFTGDNLVFQTGNDLGTGLSSDNRWSNRTNNQLTNNGSVELQIGNQGTWEGGFSYDAITYTGNVIDSLYTVYGNQAVLNHGLAPWGGATAGHAGTTTFTIPQLNATGAMQPLQTGTRRDIFSGNFKYQIDEWLFTSVYSHEHKEGSLEESFDGPYGGTAFGLPVNYDTDRLDVTAAYNTHINQAMIQYTFSHFTDNNTFVTLPYPTSNAAVPFQRSAAYSTPPSNEAHYVTVQLATNAIPNTRVNLNVRVGVEKQDDTFAPNTADPNPAGAAGLSSLNGTLQGTTASSLNAIATIYQVKLSATSRPLTNTDTRVYYGIDGRDVSVDQYKVNTSGTGGSSDSNLAGSAFVVPQEWLKQNAGAEVGYRVIPEYNTKVTLGYRFDDVDRSNAQVGHSSTSTATFALASQLGPEANGKLSFDYINRSGSLNFLGPWAILGQGQSYSGAYYQAPMIAEAVTLRADYTPSPTWSTDFFMRFRNENYTYNGNLFVGTATPATVPLSGTGGGVKQDYTLSLGPDFNYRPTKAVSIHFFYTYEQLFYNNLGNGACSDAAEAATAACLGTAGYFQNKDTSSTHTVGVSGDWQVTEKLKLRGDYTFSYGTVMFGQYNGVFIANPTASYQNVTNYPDIDSTMHNVTLTATYQLTPRMELILQGMFAYYHDNNWNDTANAIQGAGTSTISILTPGYSSPNYSVGMIMTGVRIKL
jgi:MtrB/PioB family decaheme-associated outer membrane protein